ncbi:MAG: tetratricopeptide repeat protein [bacterium]|nr:tetratricopeptide repeat protein [bacterium]
MKKTILLFCSVLLFTSLKAETSFEYFQKGEDLMAERNYEDALFYYKKSLEKNPYFSKALLKAARISLEMDNFSEAALYLNKFLKVSPKDIEGINLLGSLFLKQDKLNQALPYFNKARSIEPLNYDALNGLANIAIKQKNYGLAESYLSQLLKIDGKKEDAYISYARIFLLKNKTIKAQEYIDKAVDYNPGSSKLFFYKGVIESKKKDLNKARGYFERSYALNPNSTDTVLNLIYVYFNLKAWDKAEDFLNKVLVTMNDIPLLYNQAGLVHEFSNDIDKAIEDFKKAYMFNVTDDVVRYHLESLLMAKKSFYDKDRKELARYHFILAEKYDQNFQKQDALFEYKRGLQIQSENSKERDRLGLLYKKDGMLEKYLKELEIAALLEPGNKTLSDRLEKARTFRNKTLSYQLKLNQYAMEKDRIKLFISYPDREENRFIHFQAGQVLADSIANHLGLYNKFRSFIPDRDNAEYYFSLDRNEVKKMASREGCDYYCTGAFQEENDFFSLHLDLYSVKFDEPLRHFISTGKGKDKIYLISSDMSKQLDAYFPVAGTIMDIRNDQLVINLGKDDGLKTGDRLEIFNRGFLIKDFVLEEYNKTGPQVAAYARVKEVDEQLCLAELERPADIDNVSLNNSVKKVIEKKKSSVKK